MNGKNAAFGSGSPGWTRGGTMIDSTISLYSPTMLSVNTKAVIARMLRVCCTSRGWRWAGKSLCASAVGISKNALTASAKPYRVSSMTLLI